MAKALFANNASTTIAEFLSQGDTQITVQDGSIFPTPGPNEFFIATIIANGGNIASRTMEIVKVTSNVNNVFTVVRGQENTSPKAFLFGSQIEMHITAGALGNFYQASDVFINLKSIAALRTYPSDQGNFVFVQGYYDTLPGTGGGFYYQVPSDTTSPDNGGSIIVGVDGMRWYLSYDEFITIEQFGAVGDFRDSTVSIQNAVDFCAAKVIPLHAGPGTFGLNLDRVAPVEGYALARCGILLKNGITIYGAGMGVTTFKLLDNQTPLIPAIPWFNLMTINTVVSNFVIQDITLDINGQNNPISRPGEELPGYTCAGVMVTGSVASVGVDARLYDSVFRRVEVKNNPGVTNIGVGSRYNNPGISGWNIRVEDCKFYNSGIDSQDHSSVFCMADNVTVSGCSFDHPTMSTGVRGPIVAIEIHGSENKAYGNVVRNYCQMFWIGAGEDGERNNVTVENNSGVVSWWGGGIWTNPIHTDPIHNINVNNNTIWLTGDVITNPHLTGTKYGLYFAIGNGVNVLRGNVNNNIIYCTDRVNNTGMFISANTGSIFHALTVSKNLFSGFSIGILAGTSSGALSNLLINDNFIENCATTTAVPANTRGIDFRDASAFTVEIRNNTADGGDIGVPPAVGLNLSANAVNLFVEGNNVDLCPIGINDVALVSGRRLGRQARTFAALPAQSTWKIGDTVYLFPAPMLGVSPNRFIMDGWQRMTDGTSNVLGTDWQERRMLTGT